MLKPILKFQLHLYQDYFWFPDQSSLLALLLASGHWNKSFAATECILGIHESSTNQKIFEVFMNNSLQLHLFYLPDVRSCFPWPASPPLPLSSPHPLPLPPLPSRLPPMCSRHFSLSPGSLPYALSMQPSAAVTELEVPAPATDPRRWQEESWEDPTLVSEWPHQDKPRRPDQSPALWGLGPRVPPTRASSQHAQMDGGDVYQTGKKEGKK